MKWVIELRQHEIDFILWKVIKEQALADFLVEMGDEGANPETYFNGSLPEDTPELWKIFVDRASRKRQCGQESLSSLLRM